MLAIHLLGPPRIELEGSPVHFDTRKAIALLAYMAVTGEAYGRDSLAAMLWPESDDLRARAALRRTLSALKGAIGGDLLRADRISVGLNPDSDIWLDVAEFDAKARAEDVDSRTLEEAAALYRGDFMAGLLLRDSPDFDDWQMLTSQQLQRTLAMVLETLVRHCSASQELERAITHARRWSSLDPMHEAAHRSLMDLYARSGQRSAALRQYRDCVRILESELGVPPLAETTAVYDAIKENRLDPVRPDSSDGGGAAIVTQVAQEETTADFPFVGRSDELKQVLRRYGSLGSDGHLSIVEGEMGIGKTRLAKEVAAQVRSQGATVLRLRCYEGESNVAYGPIVECLRTIATQPGLVAVLGSLEGHLKSEIVRLVPDFQELWSDLPDIRSLSEPGAQSHLLESVSRALVEVVGRQGLIFIDDLQWLDAASLDVLSYLVRRLQG